MSKGRRTRASSISLSPKMWDVIDKLMVAENRKSKSNMIETMILADLQRRGINI